ncbi:MAG TPA: ATP synthase F0 subunit B [Clostridiaceae bacterium]|nr:ATP synthase F0 subunit B [Clostridiaceae bacterium]
MADNRYNEYDDGRYPSSYDEYEWDKVGSEVPYGVDPYAAPHYQDSDYGAPYGTMPAGAPTDDYGDDADYSGVDSPGANLSENDLIDLIDRVEKLVLESRTLPFSNNVVIDREELLFLVGSIRDNLPDEISRARWLIAQNQQVIEESRRIADTIVRQAERREATMINEHEITLQARQRATQTIEAANHSARQIREGALEYAGKRLNLLEEQLTAMLVTIQKNKKELR